MDDAVVPDDPDREGALIMERSALRDEVTALQRRMSGTVGGGAGITVLFLVASLFMERSGTLWFLGAMWLFFSARLFLIHRTSGRELQIKEAVLESLAGPPGDTALPDSTA